MEITTRIAHGTDVIHATLVSSPLKLLPKNNRLQIRRVYYLLAQLPPFKIKVLQVDFMRFESEFLCFLIARLTHNHVQQYPASLVFADQPVSFARERSLTMIAK